MPKHTQMPESSIIQWKQNAYISSINHVHYNSFVINIICKDEVTNNTYLSMKNSPATSYVAATFHPTIGQLAH